MVQAAASGIDTISADSMGQLLATHPLYDGAGEARAHSTTKESSRSVPSSVIRRA